MGKGLTERVANRLKDRVATMLWRHQQIIPFDLTHDECLDLIAPKEHHRLLTTAATVAQVSSYGDWVTVTVPYVCDGVDHPKVSLYMHDHEGKQPPLRPRTPMWHPAPMGVQAKVVNWLTRRMEIGRLAATTNWLIEQLDERCDNGNQVRYLWPAIMHLFAIDDSDHCARWVSKYGAYKAVPNTPKIEPWERRALIETSQWLTQGQLLHDVREHKVGEVEINVHDHQTFWLGPDADKNPTFGAVILTRK